MTFAIYIARRMVPTGLFGNAIAQEDRVMCLLIYFYILPKRSKICTDF